MFKLADFSQHIAAKNSHFGRHKTSSLQPLLNILAGVKAMPAGNQKAAIQEAIYFIPDDKQRKYTTALAYLATSCGVKICGCPIKPIMEFDSFRQADYLYHALDPANKEILNTMYIGHVPLQSLHHVFKFKFKSSTGNMASLASVGTREHVKFRTQPGGPPFTLDGLGNTPLEFNHGESKSGANSAIGLDDHMTKPPSLITRWPLVAGELIADQWYQFTVDKGMTWHNIPGAAYNLIKGVRKSGNTWVFYFIKKNWVPHNTTHFKFEAEYAINPASPALNSKKKLGKCGQAVKTNIRDYAHKVISLR